ncbi:MAG: HAD family hydrolase [Ruminococcus sp.]|nr:HAD family hydrolase [Ruminococcus sp.]
MIKLIATDIDGTLVNQDKQLPPDFDELLEALKEKGISFAVSSGRSLVALQEQFGSYMNDISIVCDNGALIMDKGSILSCSVMPRSRVIEIIDVCEQNDMIPLLCTPYTTFIPKGNAEYREEVALYYKKRDVLDDLRLYDGEVTKVAIFQKDGIEQNGLELLKRHFGSSMGVVLSGFYWADIMNTGVTKGRGVQVLQQRLGASYESTMAFGDYLNDIDMLNSAYYSFAMKNAHPQVKSAANFQTGSNDEFAVVKEIKKLIFPQE